MTNITENRMETVPPRTPVCRVPRPPQRAVCPRGDGGKHVGQGAVPAAAVAHSCCSRTGPPCPASGSHVSAAAAAALPSASSLPAGRTATENRRGPPSGRHPLRDQCVHRPSILHHSGRAPCLKSSPRAETSPCLQGAHRLAGTLRRARTVCGVSRTHGSPGPPPPCARATWVTCEWGSR